jgi:hypothetical protein
VTPWRKHALSQSRRSLARPKRYHDWIRFGENHFGDLFACRHCRVMLSTKEVVRAGKDWRLLLEGECHAGR